MKHMTRYFVVLIAYMALSAMAGFNPKVGSVKVVPSKANILWGSFTKNGTTSKLFEITSATPEVDLSSSEWDVPALLHNANRFSLSPDWLTGPTLTVKSEQPNDNAGFYSINASVIHQGTVLSDSGELYVHEVNLYVVGYGERTEVTDQDPRFGVKVSKTIPLRVNFHLNDGGRGNCTYQISLPGCVNRVKREDGQFIKDENGGYVTLPSNFGGNSNMGDTVGGFWIIGNDGEGRASIAVTTPEGDVFQDYIDVKSGSAAGGGGGGGFPPGGPWVSLSIASNVNPNAVGLNEGGTNATVTASLSTELDSDVLVSLGVTGTATQGLDFTISNSFITIPAGSTEAHTTISSIDDSIEENDETILVAIDAVSGGDAYEYGEQEVTATIFDDDGNGGNDLEILFFQVDNSSINENGGVATFHLVQNQVLDIDMPWSIFFSGTANGGSDYVMPDNQIVIPAGSDEVSFTITALDDEMLEGNETVVLSVEAFQAETIIVDDDISVDILRVPTYLFANAYYATPIKFKVGGDGDDIRLDSVDAEFYYNGTDSVAITGLLSRTMVLNGENANSTATTAEGKGNEFECYIGHNYFKGISLPPPHRIDDSAYFIIKIKCTPQGSTQLDLDSSYSHTVAKLTRFCDDSIAAWDTRPATMSDAWFETEKGEFHVQGDQMQTEYTGWGGFDPLNNPSDWRQYVGGKSWVEKPWIVFDQSGTIPVPKSIQWMDISGNTFTYNFNAPYWSVFQSGAGTGSRSPKWSTVFEVTNAVPNGSFPQDTYEDCSFISGAYAEPNSQQRTMKCGARQLQGSHDNKRGIYISKNVGMKYGGHYFVSYGGKDVSCLTETIDTPWGSERERAMDLDKETAKGNIRLGNGHWSVLVSSESKVADAKLAWVTNTVLTLDWALKPTVGGNPVDWFKKGAKIITALFGANPSTPAKGKARAGIYPKYQIHGTDGETSGAMTDGSYLHGENQRVETNVPKTLESAAVRDLTVGQQFSYWIDFESQVQEPSWDTNNFYGTWEAKAHSSYEWGTDDNWGKIRVLLYER